MKMKKFTVITNISDDILVTELSLQKLMPTFYPIDADYIYILCGHTRHFALQNIDVLNSKFNLDICLVMQISTHELLKFADDDNQTLEEAILQLSIDMEHSIRSLKERLKPIKPNVKICWALLNSDEKTFIKY